ncbi:hypothetical protein OJF2_01780 [Aquisphaera giovannonii]|uniref:Uncharacterized protein n=1 Tax=Aquisphaera giovannonii TaxID=406548 RepID=A0A5B9VTN3_9BACT|nr:hypothetical protein [Aquisphaera giovannonii]QEH31713.1 hypothetical protein OJF2_01780 [Aquisphaera giovannonii]
MQTAFSIRESLQGHLQDFVQATGFECTKTEALVRDIVCLLSAYREEDVPLFPHIYVVHGADALATIAPGAERITLGKSQYADDSAKDILKKGASLAIAGWSVFIARAEHPEFEYGIFRDRTHSFSVSAEESLADIETPFPALLIRNRGHFVVELVISNRRTYTVSFTSSPASPSSLSLHVSKFARIASSRLPEDRRADFVPYLKRLVTDKLLHSHGTLLAVVDTTSTLESHDATLDEGTWLAPVVDLAMRRFRAYTEKTDIALADLQAAEALLEGMVNSDGVVVFGADGTLRAFRVFLRPNENERSGLPEKGGGRRRTYELMKKRTTSTLLAALYRSQDGDTDCSGEES